jgi:hypothetical protein
MVTAPYLKFESAISNHKMVQGIRGVRVVAVLCNTINHMSLSNVGQIPKIALRFPGISLTMF